MRGCVQTTELARFLLLLLIGFVIIGAAKFLSCARIKGTSSSQLLQKECSKLGIYTHTSQGGDMPLSGLPIGQGKTLTATLGGCACFSSQCCLILLPKNMAFRKCLELLRGTKLYLFNGGWGHAPSGKFKHQEITSICFTMQQVKAPPKCSLDLYIPTIAAVHNLRRR